MSNILIVGDSWGCGEWNQTVQHKGLELYLSKKHKVENLSVPGGCNLGAHNKIKEEYQNYDYIIWVVTEPERNLWDWNYYYDKEKITDQYDKGKDMYANCVESHERVINTIKELCGEKTILIGGMHKLIHSGNLYNKFLYTANWVDLIRKNDLKTWYVSTHELAPHHERNAKREYLDFIAKDRKHFWPDAIHPNRLSHKILYDTLEKQIKWT